MKTVKKRQRRTNAAGNELLAAVREVHRAITTGDYSTLTIREVEIPDPGQYGPREIKALRGSLAVSQALFARLVGVSPQLVAHWEYGIRHPAPVVRRLLDRISKDPAEFLDSLVTRRRLATVEP